MINKTICRLVFYGMLPHCFVGRYTVRVIRHFKTTMNPRGTRMKARRKFIRRKGVIKCLHKRIKHILFFFLRKYQIYAPILVSKCQ